MISKFNLVVQNITRLGAVAFTAAALLAPVDSHATCPDAGDVTTYVNANSENQIILPITNGDVDLSLAVGACKNGTVYRTPGTTNSVTYSPKSNYHGPDSFSYVVKSADSQCLYGATGQVLINPCAKAADGTITMLGNMRSIVFDLPIENVESGFVLSPLPDLADGTLELVPGTSHTVKYSHGKIFRDGVVFSYAITSTAPGGSGCGNSMGRVRVIVPPPVADSSIVYLDNADPTTLPAPITPNGHEITLGPITSTQGSVSWSTETLYAINYTPDPKLVENVAIDYTIQYRSTDILGTIRNLTGTILVNPCPRAQDAAYQTIESEITIELPVQYPDRPFPLTFTQPPNGTVTQKAGTTGTLIYTKNAGHLGPDTFTYTVGQDIKFGCSASTAEVTVESLPRPRQSCPKALETVALTTAGTPIAIRVLTDGKATDVAAADPANGTAHTTVPFSQDVVLYTPDPGFSGVDSFTYTVMGSGCVDTTNTLYVGVVPANNCPTAPPIAVNLAPGESLTQNLTLGTVADPDSDVLSAWLVTNPSHGTAALTPAGILTYTPNGGFSGTDTFSYKVTDGSCSAAATVEVTVGGNSSVTSWPNY